MTSAYAPILQDAAQQMYGAGLSYEQAIKRFRSQFILAALDCNRGNQGTTSRVIGIHRNTVHREAKLCGISRKRRT